VCAVVTLLLLGVLRWAAALSVGVLTGLGIYALRLDVLPAVVVAFGGGCVAGLVSTPGYTKLADIFSLIWLASGAMLGFAVIPMLAQGGPNVAHYAVGWVIWVPGAAMVGFILVTLRDAEEDSFFGQIRRRWRGRS
jgi:hypothetical protein